MVEGGNRGPPAPSPSPEATEGGDAEKAWHEPVKGSDPRERYNTNGQDGQRRSSRPSSYPSLPFSRVF